MDNDSARTTICITMVFS